MKKIEHDNIFHESNDCGCRICWNWRTFYSGDKSVVFTVTYCDGRVGRYHVMGEHGHEYSGYSAVEANRKLAIALRDIGVI